MFQPYTVGRRGAGREYIEKPQTTVVFNLTQLQGEGEGGGRTTIYPATNNCGTAQRLL